MMKNQVIGGVIILVVVAGGSFYAGKSIASSTPTAPVTRGAGGFGLNGQVGRAGARAGGGFTAGQIVSSSNGSISIQQQNGSSTEIVLISPTTQILKSVVGTPSDLSNGTTVTVTGTSNSDGSLTATAIQIRPKGMNFGGTRGATGASQSQ